MFALSANFWSTSGRRTKKSKIFDHERFDFFLSNESLVEGNEACSRIQLNAQVCELMCNGRVKLIEKQSFKKCVKNKCAMC